MKADMQHEGKSTSLTAPLWISAVGAGLLLGAIAWLWTLHGESVYFTRMTNFLANCL
ncbi:MAG: hypothetical protein KDJ48_08770 [Nitratireductor sp.]|nr:hypothetical protein [Nitratireductor sp.]MCB1457221.1 hypothetical protein [Nitratireductor sp.]MCB1459338.1 hypothetical protein [Nitratireductor sp.]